MLGEQRRLTGRRLPVSQQHPEVSPSAVQPQEGKAATQPKGHVHARVHHGVETMHAVRMRRGAWRQETPHGRKRSADRARRSRRKNAPPRKASTPDAEKKGGTNANQRLEMKRREGVHIIETRPCQPRPP